MTNLLCKWRVQVRRYVYRDVVKQTDLAKYADASDIQTYTINQAKAVFISAKDKGPVGGTLRGDASCTCRTCCRSLRDGFLYCSLSCKVRTRGDRSVELQSYKNSKHVSRS